MKKAAIEKVKTEGNAAADRFFLRNQRRMESAPVRPIRSVEQFFVNELVPVIEHPLYSPDFVSCDFYLSQD